MLIDRLVLKNLLSFKDSTIKLGQLNVLIGPNAVGKSNLIEAIGLLQATPQSFQGAILRGGGIHQWIWLGDRNGSGLPKKAAIRCELNLIRGRQHGPVAYELEFAEDAKGPLIVSESIKKAKGPDSNNVYFQRAYNKGNFAPAAVKPINLRGGEIILSPTESVLAQYKNPADPTPVTEVGAQFERIKIYREFKTGPHSGARYGVSTGAPKDSLADGSDNLALVLQDLEFRDVHTRIRPYLQRFCERFEDFKVSVGENLARVFLREQGLSEMLPAVRMSDGTLKFLSLLAVLFHPSTPPLICIEEPELGLHPDAMQIVADVLMEASESTQLVVTTHSEALIDAMSHRPESVLVCERDLENGTQMKRLSKNILKEWLKDYRLGQLWRKGQIGGGRW